MCYSKGYKYSDGDIQSFSTAVSIQTAACNASRVIKGGKKRTKGIRTKGKSKRTKGKSKSKRIFRRYKI